MNKARVFVINVLDPDLRPFYETYVQELDDYYRCLNCTCFDIANRKIGDSRYDIYVDDIGLFKEDPLVSAITEQGEPMLFGNLIIANHDSYGNTISLSDDDIDNITQNLAGVFIKNGPDFRTVLLCDY